MPGKGVRQKPLEATTEDPPGRVWTTWSGRTTGKDNRQYYGSRNGGSVNLQKVQTPRLPGVRPYLPWLDPVLGVTPTSPECPMPRPVCHSDQPRVSGGTHLSPCRSPPA